MVYFRVREYSMKNVQLIADYSIIPDDFKKKKNLKLFAGRKNGFHNRYLSYHHQYHHHTLAAAAAAQLQSCPTVRPHRRQPSRLPRPWDSPGRNTGVDCHFLLQCVKMKRESEVAQSWPTLSNPMDCCPPDSSIHGIFQARVLQWVAIAFSPYSRSRYQ